MPWVQPPKKKDEEEKKERKENEKIKKKDVPVQKWREPLCRYNGRAGGHAQAEQCSWTQGQWSRER